jgi:hypothetical protein
MNFPTFLKKLSEAPTYPMNDLWRIGGSATSPKEALLYFTPCLNFRTKTLTALIESGLELRLVNIIIPVELPVISNEAKGDLQTAINGALSKEGWRVRLLSTNGVHINRHGGSRIGFEIGKTEFISFTHGLMDTRSDSDYSTFEVPYRESIFTVHSHYFTATKSFDSMFSLIHSLLPNVYSI